MREGAIRVAPRQERVVGVNISIGQYDGGVVLVHVLAAQTADNGRLRALHGRHLMRERGVRQRAQGALDCALAFAAGILATLSSRAMPRCQDALLSGPRVWS